MSNAELNNADLQRELNHALIFFAVATLCVQCTYATILSIIRQRRSDKQFIGATQTFLQQCLKLHQPGDGLFSLHELGAKINAFVCAFNFMFFLGPQLLISFVLVFGYTLAAAEDWHSYEGPDFVAFAVGLQANPIGTELLIQSSVGKAMGLLLAVNCFALVNAVLGLTGMMGLVNMIDRALPSGILSFVFIVMGLICPLSIAVFAIAAAVVDSSINHSMFIDSFQGMLDWVSTGGNMGILEPPGKVIRDLIVRVLVALWSVTFAGVLLGIVGGHQECAVFMTFLEGDWTDLSSRCHVDKNEKEPEKKGEVDAAKEAITTDCPVAAVPESLQEAQKQIESLQAELAASRATLKAERLSEHQFPRPATVVDSQASAFGLGFASADMNGIPETPRKMSSAEEESHSIQMPEREFSDHSQELPVSHEYIQALRRGLDELHTWMDEAHTRAKVMRIQLAQAEHEFELQNNHLPPSSPATLTDISIAPVWPDRRIVRVPVADWYR